MCSPQTEQRKFLRPGTEQAVKRFIARQDGPERIFERQCKARVRSGKWCPGWRLRDPRDPDGIALLDFCKFHNRHNPQFAERAPQQRKRTRMEGEDKRTRARFYGKRMGPKLKAFVEECLDNPENEQLKLLEELAVMRDIAGDSIAMQAAVEKMPTETKEQRDTKDKLLIAVNADIKSSLSEVRIMADAAARIRAQQKDVFSAYQLHDVVNQITKFVQICFEDYPKQLRKFERMIDGQLRLPQVGAEGTRITPDLDVIEMDAMIPRSEEEQQLRDNPFDDEIEEYNDVAIDEIDDISASLP